MLIVIVIVIVIVTVTVTVIVIVIVIVKALTSQSQRKLHLGISLQFHQLYFQTTYNHFQNPPPSPVEHASSQRFFRFLFILLFLRFFLLCFSFFSYLIFLIIATIILFLLTQIKFKLSLLFVLNIVVETVVKSPCRSWPRALVLEARFGRVHQGHYIALHRIILCYITSY